MTNEAADVVVIGAGHNGLICGAYLARAGLEVAVVERRLEAGGGLSTEEATLPGFLHNLHSVFHDAAEHMPAMADLGLVAEGAEYVLPPVQVGLVLGDGRALTVHTERERTLRSIARFSERDARRWATVDDDYHEFALSVVVPALYAPPPTPSEPVLPMEQSPEGMEHLRMSRQSPADAVTDLFESDPVRAAVLFQLAVPRGVGPDYAGLGMLVPLVVTGVERSHLAKGGSHNVAHALWKALIKAGGRVRGMREVRRILVEGGRAVGVELTGGERIAARRAVVSAVDFRQTFLSLLDPRELGDEFLERARCFRLDEFSLFGVHLALAEPPRYLAAAFDPDIDRAFKVGIGFESTADFRTLFEDIRRGAIPDPPRLYACSPTVHDPTQAPEGFHTAFCWAVAPYNLAAGGAAAWDRAAPEYAERCLAAWRKAAPNLTPENILGRRILSPLDIERKLASMPAGGVFHGRTSLDQIEAFRPMPGLADGRTPIQGLYLAGASIHPGGGILGACGYIAAGTIAGDLGIKKWWES
ncbi:MAG: NAD(P)/FAD-dependent oxidoreductase [Planctomycetes bacterium]|nr:NAD(P)/FAD-dependent oxidoreductase [Planctomycetota bacterium]